MQWASRNASEVMDSKRVIMLKCLQECKKIISIFIIEIMMNEE